MTLKEMKETMNKEMDMLVDRGRYYRKKELSAKYVEDRELYMHYRVGYEQKVIDKIYNLERGEK